MVTIDDIANWKRRGKLHPTKTVDGVFYEYKKVHKLASKIRKTKKVQAALEELPLPEPTDIATEVIYDLPPNADITDTTIFKNTYDGLIKKQKFEIEEGKYILREEVENDTFKAVRVIRDKLKAMPYRVSPEIHSLETVHEVQETLFKEIDMILESFSLGVGMVDE